MFWVVEVVTYMDGLEEAIERDILVEETPFLLYAFEQHHLIEQASAMTRQYVQMCSEGLSWNGKPAKMVFAGIKSIKKLPYLLDVLDVEHFKKQMAINPAIGELNYREYLFETRGDFMDFLDGNIVGSWYHLKDEEENEEENKEERENIVLLKKDFSKKAFEQVTYDEKIIRDLRWRKACKVQSTAENDKEKFWVLKLFGVIEPLVEPLVKPLAKALDTNNIQTNEEEHYVYETSFLVTGGESLLKEDIQNMGRKYFLTMSEGFLYKNKPAKLQFIDFWEISDPFELNENLQADIFQKKVKDSFMLGELHHNVFLLSKKQYDDFLNSESITIFQRLKEPLLK